MELPEFIYSFVVYLTTLSITCTSERRMLRLVNKEAEGSCNNSAVV
jgi:hypothetical protein